MAIGVILGIVFAVFAVAGVIGGGVLLYNGCDEDDGKKKAFGGSFLVAGIALAVAFILVPFSFHTVDAGEIAVVKEMGKIIDTREAGTHYDFWVIRRYEKYDTKVRGVEVTTAAYSHDKQPMDIHMTIQYQVNKDKVQDIAVTYGSLGALEGRIQSVAIERAKSKLSNYDADSIIETRGSISTEIAQTVEEAIGERYYIDITNVSLTNIDFSDAYEQSVEQSMIAKQEVEKAKAEAEKAVAAAQGELQVAKLRAQAKLEAAKADADAQKLIAEAEATAVKLKSIEVARALGFTITEKEVQGDLVTDEDGNAILDEEGNKQYGTAIEYIIDFTDATEAEIELLAGYMQYIEYLAKWDGKLPTVMTDSSATVVIPANGGVLTE